MCYSSWESKTIVYVFHSGITINKGVEICPYAYCIRVCTIKHMPKVIICLEQYYPIS